MSIEQCAAVEIHDGVRGEDAGRPLKLRRGIVRREAYFLRQRADLLLRVADVTPHRIGNGRLVAVVVEVPCRAAVCRDRQDVERVEAAFDAQGLKILADALLAGIVIGDVEGGRGKLRERNERIALVVEALVLQDEIDRGAACGHDGELRPAAVGFLVAVGLVQGGIVIEAVALLADEVSGQEGGA